MYLLDNNCNHPKTLPLTYAPEAPARSVRPKPIAPERGPQMRPPNEVPEHGPRTLPPSEAPKYAP